MKIIALLFILASLAFCFEINRNQANPASDVHKVEGLTWNCQTCASTCAYGGFPSYCADAYYCVCSYQSQCTSSVKNIC